MNLAPQTTTSIAQAVSSANAVMSPTLGINEDWLFVSTTNCYIAQHASAPVAAASNGSMFVPANVLVPISGRMGAKLAVIRATADGTASLTRAVRL